jgi:hypothetical protein
MVKVRICASSSAFNFFACSNNSRHIKATYNGFKLRNSLIQKLYVFKAGIPYLIYGTLSCGLNIINKFLVNFIIYLNITILCSKQRNIALLLICESIRQITFWKKIKKNI